MKRMGIFSFYDKEGIAGDYVDFLLKDLTANLDLLAVVINGVVNDEGKRVFEKYTDKIFIRENTGYDAGAYKDVILNYIGIETVKKYQQLVLCNDTFYGPFVPFKKIFSEMDKFDIDFWGINYVNDNFANHLQSYFIAINDSVIKSGHLFEYFKRCINEKEEEILNIYACFEVGIFDFLIRRGYRFRGYTLNNHCNIYMESNYCIKNYKFPIMKKKCFSSAYYLEENVMDSLKYIDKNTCYDIDMILKDAKRVYKFDYSREDILKYSSLPLGEHVLPTAKAERHEIEHFLNHNQDIYIYGTGVIARRLCWMYSSFFQNVRGFVVSDNQNIIEKKLFGYQIRRYSEIRPADVCILVALDLEHTNCVRKDLSNCKDILCLW